MREERYNDAFLMGVILGALFGALAGLFLSPNAGWETRGQVRNQVNALFGQNNDSTDTSLS